MAEEEIIVKQQIEFTVPDYELKRLVVALLKDKYGVDVDASTVRWEQSQPANRDAKPPRMQARVTLTNNVTLPKSPASVLNDTHVKVK